MPSRGLTELREQYNHRCPHWALIPQQGGDPVNPEGVHVHGQVNQIPNCHAWAKGAKERLDQLMEKQRVQDRRVSFIIWLKVIPLDL